jgi:hypothetical protein
MKYLPGLLILMCFSVTNLHAAPASKYWSLWDKSDADSTATIDHGLWQQFLNNYLIKDGDGNILVRYSEVSKADSRGLDAYIKNMADQNPLSLKRDQQKAYWINLYNALTVQLILKNYPLDSIRDLGGLFSSGPWDDEVIVVNGTALTLNDIEHRILRPLWKDKRIHYAVNCASMGCPNLLPEAYTAERVEDLLEEAARSFINLDKGLVFAGDKLVLSSIYDWYSADFGSAEALKQHLSQYLEASTLNKLQQYRGKPEFHYDWNLNEPR